MGHKNAPPSNNQARNIISTLLLVHSSKQLVHMMCVPIGMTLGNGLANAPSCLDGQQMVRECVKAANKGFRGLVGTSKNFFVLPAFFWMVMLYFTHQWQKPFEGI